ncbi:hypothetical protein [Burkholderia cepacia]|uniref:hypothetical protein n=1 Tax=Burkholderia cepacia TaxID=292 RepID=UPI002ABD33CC|nr:hypothetical protein [Burkholderia cepacia]
MMSYLRDRVARKLGVASTVALMASLDRNAIVLGLCWLAIGIIYSDYLTKFFRAPPELHMPTNAH